MSELTDFIGLRDRDLRREGLFVAEGRLLVERTIASGLEVLGIWADGSAAAEAESLAAADVRFSSGAVPPGDRGARAIPVHVCSGGELERVAGFTFHRGMIAVARRPGLAPPETERLAETVEAASSGDDPVPVRILVLPAITDPGNLGTLLRSGLAFGYTEVWLGKESCDPFNRKALRASMGAALTLALRIAIPADLGRLKAACSGGMAVWAAAMESDALVAGVTAAGRNAAGRQSLMHDPHALVLGNEYEGIPVEWRAECTAAVRIPVSAGVDSLNVAIAGSVLMWEFARQALP